MFEFTPSTCPRRRDGHAKRFDRTKWICYLCSEEGKLATVSLKRPEPPVKNTKDMTYAELIALKKGREDVEMEVQSR